MPRKEETGLKRKQPNQWLDDSEHGLLMVSLQALGLFGFVLFFSPFHFISTLVPSNLQTFLKMINSIIKHTFHALVTESPY